MTDQEINFDIAEACGWKRPDHPDAMSRKVHWLMPEVWWLDPDNNLQLKSSIPNYCNDLNAIRAALFLLNTWRLRDNYFGWLRKILDAEFDNWKVYAAPPRHCAEALLRTLDKWKEVEL